jgi:hypothetical protein
MSNIPGASERAVPQYFLRGTLDPFIKDAAEMKAFFSSVLYQ